jgi:hypothetical protein
MPMMKPMKGSGELGTRHGMSTVAIATTVVRWAM